MRTLEDEEEYIDRRWVELDGRRRDASIATMWVAVNTLVVFMSKGIEYETGHVWLQEHDPTTGEDVGAAELVPYARFFEYFAEYWGDYYCPETDRRLS